ncbi:MAG TPA: oligoribonuclease [Candidatus Altiarchaeales archaeon]|nr:oligoribonuclease [Candidatus Altiarchaeales archaeon]
MKKTSYKLVWADMEFTGLDPFKDRVLEIATIVTDKNLKVIAEGPVIAVHQSDRILKSMDGWNTRTHTETGLIGRSRKSGDTVKSAEEKTLRFIRKHAKPGEALLCGNSIHMDRYFMKIHMPKLEAFLHYRNIDVSTVKELAYNWCPKVKPFEKKNTHRALDDIRESIEELKYYRKKVFR